MPLSNKNNQNKDNQNKDNQNKDNQNKNNKNNKNNKYKNIYLFKKLKYLKKHIYLSRYLSRSLFRYKNILSGVLLLALLGLDKQQLLAMTKLPNTAVTNARQSSYVGSVITEHGSKDIISKNNISSLNPHSDLNPNLKLSSDK